MLPKPTSGLTCCAIVAPALLGRDVPTGGFGGENSNRPIGHDALEVFRFKILAASKADILKTEKSGSGRRLRTVRRNEPSGLAMDAARTE